MRTRTIQDVTMHKPVEIRHAAPHRRNAASAAIAVQGDRPDAGTRRPVLRPHARRLGRRRIRVEPPPADGDAGELVGRRDGSDFQNLHRNKRAITLNLKCEEGREILCGLQNRPTLLSRTCGRASPTARRRF